MAKASKSTIAKKAWATRRANAKKRGVKPGAKRGSYKKARVKTITMIDDELGLRPYDPASVGNLPSLISELQSSISQLEGQLTAQIDRIKSILV